MPPERHGRGRRAAARLIWLVMGLVVIAAGVFLLDPPFLSRWLADSQEGAASESVAFAQYEEGRASPADGRLSAAADSVSHSLRVFRQRHADFEDRRISCAELSAGYARLGEHVVALARVRSGFERPSPEQEAVFEAAMDGAAEADRLFAAAGCPRP